MGSLGARQMYFGTKEYMAAIRAPQIDYDAARQGWDGGIVQYLNGAAKNRGSVNKYKSYNFSWTNLPRDQIRMISDFADGVYGAAPFYFLDPFAMDKNLLPQYWATPRLALFDGPVLTGQDRSTFIQYQSALTNSYGYPVVAPQYVYDSVAWPTTSLRPSVYIPVPSNYTLWFGAHGVVSAAGSNPLTALPDGGTSTNLQILDVNTATRFSNSWAGSGTTGVTFSLGNNTGTAIISGMMVQVLPTGTTPQQGGFISGQGNSGVSFAGGGPVLHQYSQALDMVGLTATLVEA